MTRSGADDTPAQRAFREGPGSAFQPGQWNHYRIEAQGDSLKIYVNDRLTTAYRDTRDREGPIGLQHHGEAGKVYRFRNLRIQPLGDAVSRRSGLRVILADEATGTPVGGLAEARCQALRGCPGTRILATQSVPRPAPRPGHPPDPSPRTGSRP